MNPSDLESYASQLNPVAAVVLMVLGVFLLLWTVLWFLAPFFWYGTNKRAKEISEKLTQLIELQRKANLPPPQL